MIFASITSSVARSFKFDYLVTYSSVVRKTNNYPVSTDDCR